MSWIGNNDFASTTTFAICKKYKNEWMNSFMKDNEEYINQYGSKENIIR